MAKAKRSSVWWVLTAEDGVLQKHYTGPDRKRAREVAAKILVEQPKKVVTVAKVSRLSVLAATDMRSVLPKDAF